MKTVLFFIINIFALFFLKTRRQRPTLKPSGSIVSKASEFVDIYRFPPSRPEPLYPQPIPDKTAAKCRKDVCLLPDCYCGGRDIPGRTTIFYVHEGVHFQSIIIFLIQQKNSRLLTNCDFYYIFQRKYFQKNVFKFKFLDISDIQNCL